MRIYSIIVLTPVDSHPYDVWRGEGGDIWVADFLTNEGFDRTRISIFGTRTQRRADNGESAAKELFETIEDFKTRAKLVRFFLPPCFNPGSWAC